MRNDHHRPSVRDPHQADETARTASFQSHLVTHALTRQRSRPIGASTPERCSCPACSRQHATCRPVKRSRRRLKAAQRTCQVSYRRAVASDRASAPICARTRACCTCAACSGRLLTAGATAAAHSLTSSATTLHARRVASARFCGPRRGSGERSNLGHVKPPPRATARRLGGAAFITPKCREHAQVWCGACIPRLRRFQPSRRRPRAAHCRVSCAPITAAIRPDWTGCTPNDDCSPSVTMGSQDPQNYPATTPFALVTLSRSPDPHHQINRIRCPGLRPPRLMRLTSVDMNTV